jgi:hypothetical protein
MHDYKDVSYRGDNIVKLCLLGSICEPWRDVLNCH